MARDSSSKELVSRDTTKGRKGKGGGRVRREEGIRRELVICVPFKLKKKRDAMCI